MDNFFKTYNPTTEESLNVYSYHTEDELNQKLQNLFDQQKDWKKKSLAQRIQVLKKIKQQIQNVSEQLSMVMSVEMGKPLAESKAEVQKCLTLFDYYELHAEQLLAPREVLAQYPKSQVRFQPMGIVLSFMPWNFPLWQVMRFAVPAWLAGNVILQKHSELTAGVSILIERLVLEATGLHLLENIFLPVSRIKDLYADNRIQAVTFTGSTNVGALVAEQAGRNLKKCVLELGGSDAYILDPSADLKTAIEFCAKAKLVNNGQSCVAAKRFFVPEEMLESFVFSLSEKLKSKKMGNPLESGTDLGPLASQAFKNKIQSQWDSLSALTRHSLNTSSELMGLNNRLTPDKGYFFSPKIAVVSDLKPAQEHQFIQSFQEEEFFGPVALVYSYKSQEEMLYRVNQSPYGLGAAWFGDPEKFAKENMADQIDVGMIAVNEMIKSDARLPFGGVKKSGFGRELGDFGIFEFCSVQTLGWG